MDETEEDEEVAFIVKGKFPKWKVISIAIAVFLSSSYGYYYYEYIYMPKQEIPTLLADESPIRVKPEKPGGALMPNTDKLVYENLKPGRIENSVSLMPEPEEPVIITKESEEENPDKIDDIIGNILSSSAQTDEKKEEQASIPAQEEEQNPQPLTSQEDVKTLKIIPVEENRSKKRKNSEKTEGEYYRIQLVSVRTKEDADKEWDRMKKLYPKQLGNLPHIVQKVNLQNKGIFYRLLAGKFQSLGTAKTTCKKISSISHCVIVSY